jgi:hypothetical protein
MPHGETSGRSEDDFGRAFGGSWEAFEAWVRQTIGGDFVWKLLWRDTPAHRQMIVDSIRSAMAANGGLFPEADTFLERRT